MGSKVHMRPAEPAYRGIINIYEFVPKRGGKKEPIIAESRVQPKVSHKVKDHHAEEQNISPGKMEELRKIGRGGGASEKRVKVIDLTKGVPEKKAKVIDVTKGKKRDKISKEYWQKVRWVMDQSGRAKRILKPSERPPSGYQPVGISSFVDIMERQPDRPFVYRRPVFDESRVNTTGDGLPLPNKPGYYYQPSPEVYVMTSSQYRATVRAKKSRMKLQVNSRKIHLPKLNITLGNLGLYHWRR